MISQPNQKKIIKIGTRGSKLALVQANWVADQIRSHHPGTEVDLVIIKTTGDKILDVPLAKVGGKGLFVKEIEDALQDRRVDLAVHSMKDVPTEIPAGLGIRVITEREDPRDVLITHQDGGVQGLPLSARVGTSSLRRQAQIKTLRKDLIVLPLRGNLDTRVKKLIQGEYEAVILAAAGLNRLSPDLGGKKVSSLNLEDFIPAVGQGALGIEMRLDDIGSYESASFLNHPETAAAVTAERAFLITLEGGCQVPIGGLARLDNGRVHLSAFIADPEGEQIIRGTDAAPLGQEELLGVRLARHLLDLGG
ncbi:MAG: hydroxymethylbilane synthase, partial [Deltaproteobacteria bacterium]|nr:hydroxymethylbilane synthase [Deltaproteobacteria bacterium]